MTDNQEAVLADHSHPVYRPLMLAVRAADEAFEKAGDAGTKTWLDDYFLPELDEHGLTIVRKDTLAELRAALKDAMDKIGPPHPDYDFGDWADAYAILRQALANSEPRP